LVLVKNPPCNTYHSAQQGGDKQSE